MKKMLFIALSSFLLTGCGNSWEMFKKDFKSDYTKLNRDVIVYDSFSGKELWRFSGEVYLNDDNCIGDFSFIYKDEDGKYYKNDFIGRHLAVSMKEIVD